MKAYRKQIATSIMLPFINGIGALVTSFLGLRFILKLFGASAGAPFVRWMYEVTEPLLRPFSGMFPSPTIERGYILEFSTLFAMIIYSVIFYFIVSLVEEIEARTNNRVIR